MEGMTHVCVSQWVGSGTSATDSKSEITRLSPDVAGTPSGTVASARLRRRQSPNRVTAGNAPRRDPSATPG